MRLTTKTLLAGCLLSAALPLAAAEPRPEIERPAATPQATGQAHALRTIVEACVRLEGRFTGDVAAPYDFSAVRTSASCQPRAHLVDAAKVRPTAAGGWKLNDVIRVPHADCAAREAIVTVWRKPAGTTTPALDGQGRARVYLDDSMEKVASGDLAPVTLYAAALTLQGDGCP